MLCGISTARDEESVFKMLTADELRNTSLRQSLDVLRFVARAGETVRIAIRAAEQGAVIQEDVTAILDCGPWLSKFPGGSVNWYKYVYLTCQLFCACVANSCGTCGARLKTRP